MTTTLTEEAAVDLMDHGPFLAGTEHDIYDRLRRDHPLHWNDEPDGPGFWSLTRYADVVAASNDYENLINGEGTQILSRKVEGSHSTVHNTDPPRHAKLRRIVTPPLRAGKVRAWQEMIDQTVADVLDAAEAEGELDLVDVVSSQLPIRVLGQVLGVPAEDCGLLLDFTNRITSDDPEFMTTPDEKERARTQLFDYFHDLTEQRRRKPEHDLISVLIEGTIDGEPLDWPDLAAYYFVLVGAGNETTRNLITGSVLAFDEFPGELERLRADRSLLAPAVEESLRWVTPIRCMRRTAVRDLDWHGETIRQGDKVVLWYAAANRDPEAFDEPARFIVDRAPNNHVGFGWGIHACLGSHLARAEAVSFIRQWLDRDLQITPLAPPDRLESNQFNAYKRLRVAVGQR